MLEKMVEPLKECLKKQEELERDWTLLVVGGPPITGNKLSEMLGFGVAVQEIIEGKDITDFLWVSDGDGGATIVFVTAKGEIEAYGGAPARPTFVLYKGTSIRECTSVLKKRMFLW